MKVICDVEADGLYPSRIWVVVCKNIDTGEVYEFREPDKHPGPFISFAQKVTMWVGHNFIGYDYGHLNRLVNGLRLDRGRIVDTLVVSRLVDFSRPGGHSLGAYGEHFGIAKPVHEDWSKLSEEMVHRCRQDVEINHKLYLELLKYIQSPLWKRALRTSHELAFICTELHENGFGYNLKEAKVLKEDILSVLIPLEKELKEAFPKVPKVLKEVVPRYTKAGTLNRSDFRWYKSDDLSSFNGGPFTVFEWQEFNPGSVKQRVDRLWEAGWEPTEKSKGHKDYLSGKNGPRSPERTAAFERYGWTTSEENLATLPDTAPPAAQLLVKWLLLISRVRRLTEWEEAVEASGAIFGDKVLLPQRPPSENSPVSVYGPVRAFSEGKERIHGTFNPIGAWTERMSHANPNMGNIPKFDEKQPHKTPYSDRMRALWRVDPNTSYLVGVDAESIQLRVLAHYLDDPEFTKALVSGKKEDGTDPHSVNQRALNYGINDPESLICKSRDDAKTWVYAWLLGSGVQKGASVLRCSTAEYEKAIKNLLDKFENLRYLKDEGIPRDAINGYFQGFDGRCVKCRGDDVKSREHYMLGGYLQNGEITIMSHACIRWHAILRQEKIPFKLVNFVHDEWQTEVPRDLELAKYVARVQCDAIRDVGIDLGLKCPLAGSNLGGGIDGLAIGNNWWETH